MPHVNTAAAVKTPPLVTLCSPSSIVRRRSRSRYCSTIFGPARVQDAERLLPRGVRVVLCQHRVGVEQIIDVHAGRHAGPRDPEDLGDPQLHLGRSIDVRAARREDVHRDVLLTSRQGTSETRYHGRVGRDVVGRDLRPGSALHRRRHLDVDLRHGVGPERLDVREELGLITAVGRRHDAR